MSPGEQYPAGVEHSAKILQAAGYALVPLVEPIGKAWDLLGIAPHGVILVSVVRGDWPEPFGLQRLGVPSRWPTSILRVVHKYGDESPWPEVRVL